MEVIEISCTFASRNKNVTNMPRSTRKKSKTGTCHVMLRVNTEPSPVHQEKFKTGKEHYRLLTNNCADIVKDIFEKGTDSDLHMGISPSPNDNFSNIKENKEGIQKEINDKIYDEKKK